MRSPIGKIMSAPDVQAPVFEDLSGLRMRRVKSWAKFAFFGTLLWALAIAVAVLQPAGLFESDDAPRGISSALTSSSGPGDNRLDAGMLIDAKAPAGSELPTGGFGSVPAQRPRCVSDAPAAGAALAAAGASPPLLVYALLPNDVDNAFLPLLRNCNRVDVILPEWYEIDGPSLAVSRTEIDAEMSEALDAIRVERSEDSQIWPVVSLGASVTARNFLDGLGDKKTRSAIVDQMIAAAVDMKAQAACLRLRDVKPADAKALEPFLTELETGIRAKGLDLCLIASLTDQLWTSKPVVAHFDKVIVTAYQEPWIGAYPQPLAPLDWLKQQLVAIQNSVPTDKLVVAIGGHAVDWVSGRAVPERISIAEAMFRVTEANASIEYAPKAKNSFSSFFDRAGNRHQIWMLDAASVYNSLAVMQDLGIRQIAIPSLGQEEPAYWDMLDGNLSSTAPYSLGAPGFPDNVAFVGEGAFYRFDKASRPGRRLWRLDQDGTFIESLYYDVVPRPVRMERYGARVPKQIALTFDDGPDAVATRKILDVLKKHDAPATFFVVGKAALSSPELLTRAIDEGHTIGSHSFSHPYMEDLGPFMARTELSANRSLIEGITGRSPLLFRPPYIRGPGPLNEVEAKAFAILEEEGYFVAGSDMVPTDWAGASATEIVRQVIGALEKTGGNVIVLHDGRSTGMYTAEAVDMLVPELRARGYDIVALPLLLGKTPAAVMPGVDMTTSVFKGLSVSAIAMWIAFLTLIFWICIFASILRSAFYLFLSSRRDPVYPRSFVRTPTATVVVPAYNEDKVIVATVRSILNSNYPGLACIVVDDGSTDDTLAVLNATFGADPRVRVLTQTNQGKWRALNLAFQSIDTEIAICVDADTRISPDAISEIMRPFADSKVAAVAGTVVVANTRNLLTQFQSVEYITAQQIGRRAQEHLNGILVVPGALGAWRVEAVRDVGLFSNETLTEDADLTIWLRRGGFRVAYAEGARSYTEAPTDVRSLLKQRLRWSFGNLQTLWKHRSALFEFGPKRLFSMLDMAFFGYVLPVISPILDALFLYFLANLFLDWQSGRISDGIELSHLAVLGVAMVQVMDIVVAWIAHRREGAPKLRLLYLVPMMNLFYRPLLYITVYRALWAALSGRLALWNKLRRQGLDPQNEVVAR